MKKSPQKNETPRQRFKRLAAARTNLVLKRLKVLGNCANRSFYHYNEQDIEKIFSEIDGHTQAVKAKFSFPQSKRFKL